MSPTSFQAAPPQNAVGQRGCPRGCSACRADNPQTFGPTRVETSAVRGGVNRFVRGDKNLGGSPMSEPERKRGEWVKISNSGSGHVEEWMIVDVEGEAAIQVSVFGAHAFISAGTVEAVEQDGGECVEITTAQWAELPHPWHEARQARVPGRARAGRGHVGLLREEEGVRGGGAGPPDTRAARAGAPGGARLSMRPEEQPVPEAVVFLHLKPGRLQRLLTHHWVWPLVHNYVWKIGAWAHGAGRPR